jgi:hypothetical protein
LDLPPPPPPPIAAARPAQAARPVLTAALPLPFVLMALMPGLRFGMQSALAGLLIAALVTFAVAMPIVAVLSGAEARGEEDLPDAELTPRRYAILFGAWTLAAWAGGAYAGMIFH